MSELRKQNAVAKIYNLSEYGVTLYDFHDKGFLRYIGSNIARYNLDNTLIDAIVANSNKLDDHAKHQLESELTYAYNVVYQRSRIGQMKVGGLRID